MTKPIHPFPARMAPGLALDSLSALPSGSVVLDPMSGSGTVIRQATDLGHAAKGYDVDPLAVLMSKVWTTPVKDADIGYAYLDLLARSKFSADWSELSWINDNQETKDFISFWFEDPQLADMKRLAAALADMAAEEVTSSERAALDILRLNLSRIVVTKEQASSLARDTSHSRPHKVKRDSPYDVFTGYDRSLTAMRRRLLEAPPRGGATVGAGDARKLNQMMDGSVDAIVTSPPYLNAIDYLRGHRLALVWLGWTIPALREIRSGSIGAERAIDKEHRTEAYANIVASMLPNATTLLPRHTRMVERYANDLWRMMSEVARVLKKGSKATFVVGNSCLKETFVKNDEGVAAAAGLFGLQEVKRSQRDLPQGSRYLPVTGSALGKRMRTETVLVFAVPS